MAAISVASVIRYPYSVIVLENHLRNSNLGRAYLRGERVDLKNEVGTNYYDGGGIEGLLRKIYRGSMNTDLLKSHLKEVIQEHLYYIPQTRVIHSEIFDYEFNYCVQTLFRLVEENADICFIDTASSNNLSTKTILDESDLIVVNLCQDQGVLDDFFLNYSSLFSKSVFIISNYDSRLYLKYKRIAQMYQVPIEDIIPIPPNNLYQTAYLTGSVVEFVSGNYSSIKESPHYFYINSIKKATYLIIKKAAHLLKAKENAMISRFLVPFSILYSLGEYCI